MNINIMTAAPQHSTLINVPSSIQGQNHCPADSTLWFGGINPDWHQDFIASCFVKFGSSVRNVKLVTDRTSGKPASYCFVEFSSEDDARNAMLKASGRTIPNDPDRKRFHLSFANPAEPQMEYNLFVNNLSSSVDDIALFKVFGERYKSCRGAKVHRNADGTAKESGFVRFVSETDQQMALVEMNKVKLKGREMYLKLAQPKQRIQNLRGRAPPPTGLFPQPQSTFGVPFGLPPPNQYGGPFSGITPTQPLHSSGTRDYNRRNNRSNKPWPSKRSRSRSPHARVNTTRLFIEPVEPPTAAEHNDYMMEMEWDFQLAFDNARFSKLIIPSDLKGKELPIRLCDIAV